MKTRYHAKLKLLAKILAAFALALGVTASIGQHGSAATTTFFCGTKKGTPITVARTSRGDIPVIQWVSTYFSGKGYSPLKRCLDVSDRFQTYYNNGLLNYISVGNVNRQAVVCFAKSPGSDCSGVLFTLEENDEPNLVLQQLFNVRVRASRTPINLGGSEVTQQKPPYIDLKQYLDTAAVERSISPVSQPSPETKQEKQTVPDANRPSLGEIINRLNSTEAVTAIEQSWESDYEGYFKTNLSINALKAEQIADTLGKLASQTGKKPALIYVVPTPKKLELVLVLPQRKPIRKSVPAAAKENLLKVVAQFAQYTGNPQLTSTTGYLGAAGQLYQWIIAPLQTELETNSIDTLLFCMGGGLRSMPLAALHDGQKFLVEKYSIALIPAFNMTDPLYNNIKNSTVLAMGASQFKNLPPLDAVPVELAAIVQDLSGVISPGPWQGKILLNQQFTLDNLKSQRASQRFAIVHLATHAEFKPGAPQNSYIQFWDTKLGLDKMRQLQWNNPPVDLLVLSACRTAVGDKDAEMGFAGLAVNSGVRSALASLWYVSDEGTLALMTEFYQQLRIAPIKAEALRQAQIAMIRGQVRLEAGLLRGPMLRSGVKLPPNLAELGNRAFTHPYYWSAFTMIGNPW